MCTVLRLSQLFADISRLVDYKTSGYELALSADEYARGIKTLAGLESIATLWADGNLPPEVDTALKEMSIAYESDDPDQQYDDETFAHPEETRIKKWKKFKTDLLTAITEAKTYLDLRLCATAANNIATSLGRPTVRTFFEDYKGDYEQDSDNPLKYQSEIFLKLYPVGD